jgi:hypothetical protein
MTAVTMRFPEERLATFTVSFGSADIGRYTLVGTKGVLTADPGYEYAEGLALQIKVGEKTENNTPSAISLPQRSAIFRTAFSTIASRNPRAGRFGGPSRG